MANNKAYCIVAKCRIEKPAPTFFIRYRIVVGVYGGEYNEAEFITPKALSKADTIGEFSRKVTVRYGFDGAAALDRAMRAYTQEHPDFEFKIKCLDYLFADDKNKVKGQPESDTTLANK